MSERYIPKEAYNQKESLEEGEVKKWEDAFFNEVEKMKKSKEAALRQVKLDLGELNYNTAIGNKTQPKYSKSVLESLLNRKELAVKFLDSISNNKEEIKKEVTNLSSDFKPESRGKTWDKLLFKSLKLSEEEFKGFYQDGGESDLLYSFQGWMEALGKKPSK